MDNRRRVYQDAKNKNLERWSKNTRNWELPTVVKLNPEKEKIRKEEDKNNELMQAA